ncbi:CAMK family protein kinase [Trichomonas vaginalis G3]|uniref:CAMK family protein kinase n=1 Tax=Trichomonas vaginalis (strain ATCC PRA-98 / G3) TaxID=412133 RepID=A2EF77_TRIV3|nr:protein kinase protein [Trichomonas vaginalis G3]EAY08687.1 CAMK family protein kinase [Trichomonas vaginalis G3]KAI5492814.1 protein kinase protein [Trichomonas vaginalis G3]|eukprot:XP_001320910.1 CAMK family protein kinase [Trichomonas vaginalis G3]
MEQRFTIPEGYQYKRPLGRGHLGSSYVLQNNKGSYVYCKEILKESIGNKEQVQKFKERIERIRSLNQKYILPYFAVLEYDNKLLLLRKYLNPGNIIEEAPKIKALGPNKIFAMWCALARTYHLLHQNHLAPNLIRATNLFFYNGSNIIITDLYLATNDVNVMVHNPSPLDYSFLAPEFIAPEYEPDYKADNWSLGIILAYFLTGEIPFNTKNVFTTLQQINTGTLQYAGEVSPEYDTIIKRLVKVNPTERAELSDFIKMNDTLKTRGSKRSLPRNILSPSPVQYSELQLNLPKSKPLESIKNSRSPPANYLSLASYMVIGGQSTDQVLRTYDAADIPNYRCRQAVPQLRTSQLPPRKSSQFINDL